MVITVSATSGVVYSLPKKLEQLEQQSSSALSHHDHQFIHQLRGQLEGIRSSFEVYSTLENPTEFTRQWVQKVKEVAFDIEDSIDRYIYGVHDPGNEDSSGGTLFRVDASFVDNIKRAHAHLRSMQQERLHVHMLEKPTISNVYSDSGHAQTETTTTELQLASSTELVGLDKIRKDVSTMIMNVDSAEGVRVTSIVGMAGAGKTSLAKKVYRQCQLDGSFGYLVFVSVGRKTHDLCTLLQRVLSGAPTGGIVVQHVDERDELKLKYIVRELLRDKRYLIVLDDLWSTETWRELMSCFPSNNLGSRIVTTTRIESVANVCCSSRDSVFRIPLLNECDSEALFFARSFGSKNDCPPNLRDASMHILRKCNGLPLAIVKTADLIKKASITSALEKSELDLQSMLYLHGIMKEELDQSYNDIMPQLKTCLLYLSIFPENCEVRRQRLVRRWIAEGFIDKENGKNMEETATSYLNELIDRNLIQPGHVDHDGNTRSCRVHPVIYDFIVCKSMEENFVTLVHPRGRQDGTPDEKGVIRWLSVQCKAEDQGTLHNKRADADLSHTRSLSLFGDVNGMPQLITKMEMLRVLDLEGCQSSVDRTLDVLPKLFMLRYLSLRGTDASRLPHQIGVLRHLETIDIRSTNIQELPPSIVNLHKLVYLRAGRIQLPRGVGKLVALQTLSYADISKSTASAVKELADLTNLMELAIFCSQEDRNDFLPVLKKLARHRLRSLIVAGSSGCWMESPHSLTTPPLHSHQRFKIDESVLNTIPEVVASSLVNLVELDIKFQELSAQGLRVLESIGSLLRLCLCIVSVQHVQFTFQKDGFPNLRELCFRCRNLSSLSFRAGSFPKLKQLQLNFQECSSSEEPTVSGIECLASLMHAIVAVPREDVGTKVVADLRKAALVHPKHPDVVTKLKQGEILFQVGNIAFGELGPDTKLAVPQRELKSVTDIFIEILLIIQVTSIMYWLSNAEKSSGSQSGLLFGPIFMLLTSIHSSLPVLRSESNQFRSMGIYVETGISVIIAYDLLLQINLEYYILFPFPICVVGFITYLCNEIRLQQQHKRSEDTKKVKGLPAHLSRSNDRMKIEELAGTAAIPYVILLFSLLSGDSSPVLSHFLLFSCCVLGTLAMMYSRLVDEVSPSLTPALRWIQMSYMIMIFITVHTMAAEWLGEVMALVCLPELIAGLVWFSTILHGGTCQVPCSETKKGSPSTFKRFIFDGAMFIPLGAVVASLATTYAYDGEGERLASWYTKATVAFLVAGCMPYLSVWMISRWPGRIPRSDKVTKLLKFPANICFTGACLMLFALLAEKTLAYRLFGLADLIDPIVLKYLPDIYNTTAVALFVERLANAFAAHVMELPSGFTVSSTSL